MSRRSRFAGAGLMVMAPGGLLIVADLMPEQSIPTIMDAGFAEAGVLWRCDRYAALAAVAAR